MKYHRVDFLGSDDFLKEGPHGGFDGDPGYFGFGRGVRHGSNAARVEGNDAPEHPHAFLDGAGVVKFGIGILLEEVLANDFRHLHNDLLVFR